MLGKYLSILIVGWGAVMLLILITSWLWLGIVRVVRKSQKKWMERFDQKCFICDRTGGHLIALDGHWMHEDPCTVEYMVYKEDMKRVGCKAYDDWGGLPGPAGEMHPCINKASGPDGYCDTHRAERKQVNCHWCGHPSAGYEGGGTLHGQAICPNCIGVCPDEQLGNVVRN